MNNKTAMHLTKLRGLAAPIVRNENIWRHERLGYQYIVKLIEPVQKRYEEQAQAEEIRQAARERRDAGHYYIGVSHVGPGAVRWSDDDGLGAILLKLAIDEIDAVVSADNARRLAEYEAYRAACEQGVAIPPQT
jgi:hypothetical protein